MILVEPSAINQTKQSEDFNSSEWTHLSVGQGSTPIVTDNFDYSPDGTQNATRLQLALNGGNTVTDQSIIYDLDNSNTVQTISVWMKSNTNDSYNIYLANTYTNNGTDIAQVTPQWQRFSFSHTTSNHTFSIGLRGGIGSSDSADILIWGAQAEAGSVATSYIPTSGGNAAARTRAADNLSIDPDSTNLVTHSDFSGGWQEYLINSSAGSGYSLNASRVITSTGANAAYYIPVPTSNGATYTASIWARRVSGSGGCNIIYLSSPTAKQSISLTSEFQKFTATFTGKSGGGNVNFGVDIVTSGDSIEIAMPQVELGSSPTGFIPTSGAPASRTAFTDFFSSSEGTFYAEFIFNDADGANSLIYGEYDSHRFAYKNLGSASPLLSWDGTNVLNYGRLAAGTLLRTALSYNSNTMEGSQDGSAATMSNQTAPFPHTGNFLTASKLHIGSDTNGGKQLNGHIKRLLFWPYHSDSL
jgi:hypothetical protein